jgi:hypothetical protein
MPRQIFHIRLQYLASRSGWSHSGHVFLRKFKVTGVPEINHIQFACTAAAPPTPYLPSVALPTPYSFAHPFFVFSSPVPLSFAACSTPVSAPVPIQLPAVTSSSQPPAISAHVVRNPEVMSSSFSFRENQSMLDPPTHTLQIPDSVPVDIKALLQKYPSILSTGDVKPTPTQSNNYAIWLV